MALPFYTIGHSNRTLDAFVQLLTDASIETVVDVRRFPRSRTHPHFNDDVLAPRLAELGIDYMHSPGLGGRRSRQVPAGTSPNGYWTHAGFRNYADYALSPAFADALQALRELGHRRRTTVMCSEAVWWRCHRRLIADRLLSAGESVIHLLGPGQSAPATMTPGAQRMPDGRLTYPAPVEATPSTPADDRPARTRTRTRRT